uniref:Alpha/beta fold hydrolase n=1 Tax=Phenylobacterium glaciei TaxID=2803784 RepID=A0A974P227_9CAUL|nr:alpha/beta fold hydrolase [Phenylobacterium glaciei]
MEAGQGVPVILIHGARGSAIGNWFSNGIAPKLAQTNHVYALDMRAHGLSGGARHSHFNMADDVLEFMDQMGIRKAHIAGYSMGGGVTLQLLARAPERFITACFQGSGISEVGEWKDKVPPDITGEALTRPPPTPRPRRAARPRGGGRQRSRRQDPRQGPGRGRRGRGPKDGGHGRPHDGDAHQAGPLKDQLPGHGHQRRV